jgi:hypothetical protein
MKIAVGRVEFGIDLLIEIVTVWVSFDLRRAVDRKQ